MINLKDALDELKKKSLADIQRETAYKWASRACAAYTNAGRTSDGSELVKWYEDGNEYRHEALEHAALHEDGGNLYAEILEAIDSYRDQVK